MRIARELIDPDADKVVRRLARHGFQAYLVGGCVRDLLLARTPKDFDVATNATPKEIRQLFRNCRIIGRRFRLAHIFFGPKIIETSTFRANPRDGDDVEEGDELLIRRDNVFGTDTEDARRRDFTINGLFYDVEAERVIDHVGGLEDLERHVVRTIGDPDIRFREDPVRMLRAVKFAARLGFEIEHTTLAALVRHRGEIAKCPQPRVLEELYRLLRGGAARRSLALLIDTGLAGILSPHLATLFGAPPSLPVAPPDANRAAGSSESRMTVGRAALPGATATAHPRSGDEAEWAAVWAEDAEPAAEASWEANAEDDRAPSHDPALAHDHELEDVHDPDEEADVQAELHGQPLDERAGAVDPYGEARVAEQSEALEDEDDDGDEDEVGLPPRVSGAAGREATQEQAHAAHAAGAGSAEDAAEDASAAAAEGAGADAEDAGADAAEDAGADAAEDDEEDDEDDDDFDDEFDDELGHEDDLAELGDGERSPRGQRGELFGRGTQPMPAGESTFTRAPETMERHRALAWIMLDQLDIAFRQGSELTNSLLLAALCAPFVFEELMQNGLRPVEANETVLDVLHPLAQQLQVARRDAERCRQILLAQRRLGPARRRRGKPMSLVRREFFRDALSVHHMMGKVGGFDVSDLSYWSKLHAQGESGGAAGGDELRPGKKRRRRRGGRRRRRSPVGENQSGEWEPAAGG